MISVHQWGSKRDSSFATLTVFYLKPCLPGELATDSFYSSPDPFNLQIKNQHHFSKLFHIICPLDSLSATRFENIIQTVTASSLLDSFLLAELLVKLDKKLSVEKLDSNKKSHPSFYIALKSTFPLREPRCYS